MSIFGNLARYLENFERLRKPVSLIMACALFAGVLISVPSGFRSMPYEGMEFLGMTLLVFAAMGRIWCLVYIAGRKNKELCQTGPYSLCRNPLYLFSFIGVVGFFLAAQNLILASIAAVLFLSYYRGVIQSEESRLRDLFGPSFDAYVAHIPRFWPRGLHLERTEEITVNPRIIERGLREVVWFLLAIVLSDCIELLHRNEFLHYITMPV